MSYKADDFELDLDASAWSEHQPVTSWRCASVQKCRMFRLTWVECLHVAVKKTDIHPPHVDDVEQGCDDQAPHCQEHPDQNIDWEQQVGEQEQITPARERGDGVNQMHRTTLNLSDNKTIRDITLERQRFWISGASADTDFIPTHIKQHIQRPMSADNIGALQYIATNIVNHLLSRSRVPALFLMKQNLPVICWINTAKMIISQKGLKGQKQQSNICCDTREKERQKEREKERKKERTVN